MAPTETTNNYSHETAQQEFLRLVAEYRHKALWFLRPDFVGDIRSPESERILGSIAEKSTRVAWFKVRELQRWRLLHHS